jgi:hypothetical protein
MGNVAHEEEQPSQLLPLTPRKCKALAQLEQKSIDVQ